MGIKVMENCIAETMIASAESSITIIIHACEEGGFTAECVEIPGCFSEGETEEEAEANIREAVNACLSVMFEDCFNRLRSSVDFGRLNLRCVSRQERLTVRTPQLQVAAFA